MFKYSLEAFASHQKGLCIQDITFPPSEIESLKKRETIVTHRVSDDADKFVKGDYVYCLELDENYCFEVVDRLVIKNVEDSPYFDELTDGQKTYLSKFNHIAVLTIKKTEYERPYKLETIKAKYPPKVYEKLAGDPCHSWRAFTGIDMIHLEPDDAEQKRTCGNWRLLPDKYRKESDKKSIELFGYNNLDHEKVLPIEQTKKIFKQLSYGLRDPKTGKPWRDTHKSTTMEDDFDNWKLASPKESIDAGVALCYDTVAISISILKGTSIPFKYYFLAAPDYVHDSAAHTALVYQDPIDKKWKWLEGSWGPFMRNVWSTPSSDKLISWVAKAMANMEKGPIAVRELKSYPKYGTGMMDFEKFCMNYKISQVIKPD